MQYGFRGVHGLEAYSIESLTEASLRLRMTRLAASPESEGIAPEFEPWDCTRENRQQKTEAAQLAVDEPSAPHPMVPEDDQAPQFVSTSCTHHGAPEYSGILRGFC